jgi:outer membrane biosynthesis protein TonB
MIPMTTRLHIILILTIVAVAVYMFLLYKELRIFEKDILQLRAQVNSLTMNMSDMKSKSIVSQQCVQVEKDTTVSVTDMDDDESVASEEIRDLIDTIHNKEEEENVVADSAPEPPLVVEAEPEPEPETAKVPEEIEEPEVQVKKMQDMDEEELGAQSLDALKTFLKEQGVAVKGRSAKRDLIQHILHLREEQCEEDA